MLLMMLITVPFSIIGFIIFLLVKTPQKRIPQKIGIAIMSLWFLRFLIVILKTEFDIPSLSFLHISDQSLFFLDGLLIHLYVKSLDVNYHFSFKKEFWHFLPFIIATGLTLNTIRVTSSQELYDLIKEIQQSASKNEVNKVLSDYIFAICLILHNLIYIILTYLKVKKYELYISENYSKIDEINFTWLLKLIKVLIVFLIVPIIIVFINSIIPLVDFFIIGLIATIFSILASIYLGVKLLNQKYVFINMADSFQNPSTDISIILEKFEKLEIYIKNHKSYLKEGLSLEELSIAFGEKRNDLSKIINLGANTNFFEYINSYRIESVKQELINSDEQIIQIAYKNGFSSKSTFNDVFKKKVGHTPSQYRKKHKISPEL